MTIDTTLETAVRDGQLTKSSLGNLKRWLTEPQYEPYKQSIIDLIEAKNFEELDSLFWEVIAFGTGGRRGRMAEFGSATINERTIAESAHGLVAYFKQTSGGTGGKAVVTSDTRNRSHEFAQITASVFAGHGLKVYFFEAFRSTPELSFAVRHLGCDIGVMISASHNPPSDNGFKAYWNTGGQVLAPHDAGIIKCVYEAGEIPMADFDKAVADGQIEVIGKEIDETYINTVAELSLSDERDFPAIFSPLHGVGETSCYEVLKKVGFEGVEIFEPQRKPDGNFPNVADNFPNPERPAVFDPAIQHAKTSGAELILASDPDADRLGVVVKSSDGEFVHITGNQIGTLLADYVLQKRAASNSLSADHFVVETLVTTPLIGKIAKAHGVKIIDDLLVGFKYIGEAMDKNGPDKFVFGAEESLGYLAGEYARDKDAAIAALYFMEHAAELKKQGKTLLDRLDELYVEHGYFLESQHSEVCTGPSGKAQIQALIKAMRTNPPASIGGITLAQVSDYGTHEVRSLPDNAKSADLPEPQGEVIIFDSAPAVCQIRMAVRPSGTEPKIKFYFFASSEVSDASALEDVKAATAKSLDGFKAGLSDWIQNELA